MSGFSSSRENLLSSLRSYTDLLEAKKSALSEISSTSEEMRGVLRNNPDVDIDGVLERREQDCMRYAALCQSRPVDDAALIDAAQKLAVATNDEVGRLACSVLSLHEDSCSLAGDVLSCQQECEALLKERIKATAKAIKESTQRRKLDAVYGPACKHSTPVYLDKQR